MRIIVVRTILVGFMILTIVNEYLIYIFKPAVSWPNVVCNESVECVKLLLVADPQILGDYKENWLTKFDSDRHLRNTFSMALDYVKPDGVIFLGDLFDEGSVASDEQFSRYCNRFQNIFQLKTLEDEDIRTVFIPGDNDIGGENNEIIRARHVMRFKRKFDSRDVHFIKDVQITKVNKLLRTYPLLDDGRQRRNNFKMNIAVSHLPLTNMLSLFTEQVIQNIKPEFIFAAHEHKSYAVLTLREDGKLLYYEDMKYNSYKSGVSTWTFQAAKTTNYTVITEIVVPTCSYRMGASDIGYGVIVYEKNSEEITYHVLWLPPRLPLLWLYLLFISIALLFLRVNVSYFRRLCVKHCSC